MFCVVENLDFIVSLKIIIIIQSNGHSETVLNILKFESVTCLSIGLWQYW
jgi:hypothetical protein